MDAFPETLNAEIICPFCSCGDNRVILVEQFAGRDAVTHVEITYACLSNGCTWHTIIRTPNDIMAVEGSTVRTVVTMAHPHRFREQAEHLEALNASGEWEDDWDSSHERELEQKAAALQHKWRRSYDDEHFHTVPCPWYVNETRGIVYVRDGKAYARLSGVAETAGPFDSEDDAVEHLECPWDQELTMRDLKDPSIIHGTLYRYGKHWFVRRNEIGELVGPYSAEEFAVEHIHEPFEDEKHSDIWWDAHTPLISKEDGSHVGSLYQVGEQFYIRNDPEDPPVGPFEDEDIALMAIHNTVWDFGDEQTRDDLLATTC